MHALDQLSIATGRSIYFSWARELCETAHRAFVVGPRMVWKMSIALDRPLVASMGQHDPLDGFLSSIELGLEDAAADFAAMLRPGSLATDDPLGLGGLMVDAARTATLAAAGRIELDRVADVLLAAAAQGLAHYRARPNPPQMRLAFRELGLAIGLAAVERMVAGEPRRPDAEAIAAHAGLRGEIERYWLAPEHRHTRGYLEHEDINDVMLATSLAPDGYLRSRHDARPDDRTRPEAARHP
jgi:hypothetical protein